MCDQKETSVLSSLHLIFIQFNLYFTDLTEENEDAIFTYSKLEYFTMN